VLFDTIIKIILNLNGIKSNSEPFRIQTRTTEQ
jgi:hypothetical protein